jgi:hypothetical protein
MSRYDLGSLSVRLDDEITALRGHMQSVDAGIAEESVTAEYCVIQLQDCWNRFVRDLVLRSALGNANRASGQRIRPGSHGTLLQRSAMVLLRAGWPRGRRPFYWEPSWFDQNHANIAIDLLDPSNGADLKTALNANTNPIEDVRPTRNFAAHRSERSATRFGPKAQSWLPGWQQPHQVVRQRLAGETLFEEWCRRFLAVANAAVQ